jgi:hypothetical protein
MSPALLALGRCRQERPAPGDRQRSRPVLQNRVTVWLSGVLLEENKPGQGRAESTPDRARIYGRNALHADCRWIKCNDNDPFPAIASKTSRARRRAP